MKYVLLSLPVILLIYLFFFYPNKASENTTSKINQGIAFEKLSVEEAKQKAKAEKKIIFIDVFATWCGPCKQLKQSTFKDEKVKKFFDEHFINLAIDAEKPEGEILLQNFPIQGYPTLLFINENGELVKQHLGFIDAEELLKFASSIN